MEIESDWQKILKVWNPLSQYPPVTEARNESTLRNLQMELLNEFDQMYKEIVSHPLTFSKQKAIAAYYQQLLRYHLHKKAQKLKQKVESLGGSIQ